MHFWVALPAGLEEVGDVLIDKVAERVQLLRHVVIDVAVASLPQPGPREHDVTGRSGSGAGGILELSVDSLGFTTKSRKQ